jgi:hypothetical protein
MGTQSPVRSASSDSSFLQNMIFGVLATTFAFIGLVLAYQQILRLRGPAAVEPNLETGPANEEPTVLQPISNTSAGGDEREIADI